MIDFGGYLWQAIGVGVILLGIIIAVGLVAWRRRGHDRATREARDDATRRIYRAEEQERRRGEAAARSPH